MRTVLLLLLAMVAIKTTSATTATGQEACSKPYIACLDKCVTRLSKTLQDSCMEACQTQNNACFSKVFGGPGTNVQTVRQEPAREAIGADAPPQGGKPAGEALAADEPRPAAKPARPAMKPSERRPQ